MLTRLQRGAWLLAATALLGGVARAATLGADVTVRYYDIKGAEARELRAEMDRWGPVTPDGERYDARTKWKIRWGSRLFKTTEACALRSFDVEVEAKVLLPRWKPHSNAPIALVERWTDYVAALSQHESGHVDLAQQAAAEMRLRASRLAPRATCPALEAELNAIGRQVLEEYRARERHYDEENGHGRAQGARFP